MANILIIEKQPHLRQLLEIELADADFTCFGVASSDQATDVLMVEKIDVVVLGVGWPVQDDVYMLCWLKNFYPNVPVVLFTGQEDLQPKSITRLADAWVEKSSCIDALIAEIRHLNTKFSKKSVVT